MKKKLSLDKELITSTEQIVADLDGASAACFVTIKSCLFTYCVTHCFDTECQCSVYE